MKYLKLYEEIDFSTIKEGDSIYCINNKGTDLELGKEYIVDKVWSDREQFRLADPEFSRWMGYRFTQDPHHPVVVKADSDKYNL